MAILGSLEVDTGEGPTRLGGARLRLLLARLVLDAGRTVRPQTLAEALWGAETPADWLNALQSLVSRLRRHLGDPGLLTLGPAGYRLAVEPDAVDAVRFERLARAGRRAYEQSRPAEAAALLREALSLWRGPALADVRTASFAAVEAERLDQARLAVVEDRIDADLSSGPGRELVAELEALTAEHPLRERMQAQLIRALANAGRGAEALAAYERIRVLLADTFGADPGSLLQAAHLAVLRGEPSRQHGNLDVSLTSFVGRDKDVHRILDLLGQRRLVTLVGAGGSGKTRLANAAGRELMPAGGVWFVALAPVGPHEVARVVLDLVRVRAEHGRPIAPDEVLDRLVETLADDELVLVLDNCEHVVEAAAALAATLLGRCPKLRILATSREPLRTDGETLHPVSPLELPEPGSTAEQVRACASVRLFQDRAAAVRPDFDPDGDALTAVAQICRRLDGLPLAIELAAARLRTLPVEAVADRLDDRFRLLTGGSRTALPRQQTLRAAVAWSWDLLEPAERVLLERLSVAPGSVTEAAAEAIGDSADAPELLTALVDKSLLHPVPSADPAEPRFQLLETIREYGLEQLAQHRAARDRHARFFLRLAETADPHLRTRDQLRWLARLAAERDNLSAAIGWAADSGDADLAIGFGTALCWYWFLRDHQPESLDLLGRVLSVPGTARPQERAALVTVHALALSDFSEPDETDAAYDRIRAALSHVKTAAHPLVELARVAVAIGSAGTLDRPATDRPDPWSRSFALLLQGVLAMNTGHAAEAIEPLTRALAGFEELGERWGLATALCTLEGALERSGGPGRPDRIERATQYFRELGLPEHTMESAAQIALQRAQAGDVDGGRRQLTDLLDQAGSVESRAQVRLAAARLEWLAGQLGPARLHAEAGLTASPDGRTTPPHLTASLLTVLAQLDCEEGRPAEAARRLDHPAVLLILGWHTPVAAGIAVAAAAVELARDQPEQAVRRLGAAAVLRGYDDPGEVRTIARRTTAALGAVGFAAAYAAGAAMSRAEAEDLVSMSITA